MRSQPADRITRLANHFADALTRVIAAALEGRPLPQPRKRPPREVPEKKRPPAKRAAARPVKAQAKPAPQPPPPPSPPKAIKPVTNGASKLLPGTPVKPNGAAHHDPWDLAGFKALGGPESKS